ncbi:hypothetical protein [Paenarthrobacter nicotinovorans]|uniref:hypothetical protein n=1 Tax=Paenarthrobacter nicotinovorans TaxID=29320 RepID=UPI0011A0DCBA|nr:hypothetical protein [Paenarthrobacter nicotinovorans]
MSHARLDGTPLLKAGAVTSITGRGASALIDGEQVHVGKQRNRRTPLTGKSPNHRPARSGRADSMVVRRGTRYIGVLGLMETPRASAT